MDEFDICHCPMCRAQDEYEVVVKAQDELDAYYGIDPQVTAEVMSPTEDEL